MQSDLKEFLVTNNYEFVENIFDGIDWAKNEFVKGNTTDDRKLAKSANGGNTIIYLGANKDFFINNYNSKYNIAFGGTALREGDGAQVNHFISKSNLLSIAGHTYNHLKTNAALYKNPNFDPAVYLDSISAQPQVIKFESEVTFIKDTTNTKPYFKFFKPAGILFLRELLIPYQVGYQIGIYKNPTGEFAFAWTLYFKDSVELAKITDLKITSPHNIIVYGAPGTGKSHFLEDKSIVFGNRKSRVTFYPDYSYAKFVGNYKPSTYYKKDVTGHEYHDSKESLAKNTSIINEPVIDYAFSPGPFLKALTEAFLSAEPYLLLIEEINRANAAAVFGETFQLLDRKNGQSVYKVMLSEEGMKYLKNRLGDKYTQIENGIFLPANLYIWATMNSADQGVFHMDAAFKRRWNFEYIPLNEHESEHTDTEIRFGLKKYKWNQFRKVVNDFLIAKKIPEDRLIGPFFMDNEELTKSNSIRNKLLLYLREDVMRHNHRQFFKYDTFSEITEHYDDTNGILTHELQQALDAIEIK
ncbi:hypothetical protein FFF34_009650 [Inquilinus sp. KBS0705]|nr:hypothetical protein FFF34_009650 [Inquilinus sp. KBS0705]